VLEGRKWSSKQQFAIDMSFVHGQQRVMKAAMELRVSAELAATAQAAKQPYDEIEIWDDTQCFSPLTLTRLVMNCTCLLRRGHQYQSHACSRFLSQGLSLVCLLLCYWHA
jgi:hypothetical protein